MTFVTGVLIGATLLSAALVALAMRPKRVKVAVKGHR